MVVNLDRLMSRRSKSLRASEIRELLKLTQIPGLISMAGGLPSPKAFPVEIIKQCIAKVMEENATKALQYGTTEGYGPLRVAIADRMKNI